MRATGHHSRKVTRQEYSLATFQPGHQIEYFIFAESVQPSFSPMYSALPGFPRPFRQKQIPSSRQRHGQLPVHGADDATD